MRKHLIPAFGFIILTLVSTGTAAAQGFRDSICDYSLDIAQKPTAPPYYGGDRTIQGFVDWTTPNGTFQVMCYMTTGSEPLAETAADRQAFVDAQIDNLRQDRKLKLSPVKKSVKGKVYSYRYAGTGTAGIVRIRSVFLDPKHFVTIVIRSPTPTDAAVLEKWADTLKVNTLKAR